MINILKFNGLPEEFIIFLMELKDNNNKEWFDINRQRYENSIKNPMKNLISDLSLMFANASLPYIADSKSSLFRINRDIRFSKNKEPYKTNIGLFFPFSLIQAAKKKTSAVGLYFHIEPEQVFIAGGVPYPESEVLKKVREKISSDWEELVKLNNNRSIQDNFDSQLNLCGELKNVPRGYEKTHPAAELLKKKDFGYISNLNVADIYSENLKHIILQKATALAPYLEFFREAVED